MKNIFRLSLRMQLLSVMLAMMVLSIGSLVYLQKVTEDKVFNLIQEEISGLTEAIEISMEQIKTTGTTSEARLKNYMDQLRKRGIEEVSILSEQQEVILSSNPQMVGRRFSVSKNEFFIRAKIGNAGDGNGKKIYNAFVPVISNEKLEGYIHISMYFDDLEKLNSEMFYKRVAWSLPVFGIGVILCIIIAYQYNRPIRVLINAIRSIAKGRMPHHLPSIPQAEISGLADSIQEMIQKLQVQKKMEEKLNRAEQQAMMVQLASGIAHEIRNPLNFISLSVDHLSTLHFTESAESTDMPPDLFEKIRAEIRRLNQMVTNFLDLSRELVLHPIPIRIDLPMEEALGLSSHIITDRSIQVKRDYGDLLPIVELDIDKMKSCFQNLINNAADAMPTGGLLRISIQERADLVDITIEDTGEGIPPEDLDKVYEPYFTLKKTGIGLGLAISKRLIEAHHGSINITSTPGQGTSVRLSIPYRRV